MIKMNKPLLKIKLKQEIDDIHQNSLFELSKSQSRKKNDLHQLLKHYLLKHQDQDDQDVKYMAIQSSN